MNLIDAFDNMRFWGNKRNSFLQRIRLYGILNRLIDITANIVLPIYFKLTADSTQYSLNCSDKKEGERIIVSLTSYPTRIRSVWKVIECLMRQRIKPDKIVLYLSADQFGTIDNLPKSLLNQQKRGLEIFMCDGNLRSHKKYYYAMQRYLEDKIITVDDDIFYRTDIIEAFINENKKHPKSIIANWVKEIQGGKYHYNEWPDKSESGLVNHFCFIGVSGVLYPPHSLHKDVFNETMMKELCYTTDDIWLSCMAMLNCTQVYFPNYKIKHLPILMQNNHSLLEANRTNNQVSVDNLNKYYFDKSGVRPFVNAVSD